MLFNSLAYAVFLPVVLALYFSLGHRGQNWMLLGASYLFYGWWDKRFLFLLLCSTVFDFIAGLLIDRGRLTRRDLFWASVHLVLGAFICLVVDFDGGRLIVADGFGWNVFLGTIAFVVLAYALLPLLPELGAQSRRRTGLIVSLVGNLGLLAFFKYFDFFIESAEALLRVLGFNPESFRLNLVLPIGISFYTFVSLSYTIDIYRGKVKATSSYSDYALFVTYFPHLVAGPIMRAADLLPSLQKARRVTFEDISAGCYLIVLGLMLKVAIADGVAPSVTAIYNSSRTPSWAEVVVAASLFFFQLYGDFAGYSNIARGTSRLMGIPLMVNFRLPFLSATPAEFWQRWHLSLTTWMRDYLYFSLGSNRRRGVEMYRNLFLTMTICGLWHGAAWTFAVWGAFEGLIIILDHMFLGRKYAPARRASGFGYFFRRLPLILAFFYLHLVAAIFFRSPTWDRAMIMLGAYFGDIGNLRFDMPAPTASALLGIPLLVLLEVFEYVRNDEAVLRKAWLPLRVCVYAAMILLIVMGTANESKQFIYFQF